MTDPIRVAIADDQELLRSGLSMVLGSDDGLQLVGEAADGDEAVELVRRHRIDVLLMDVRMPRMDGITATGQVLAASPGTRVLMLTTFDADEYVHAAVRAGASGFLLKDAAGEEILRAVRAVAAGDAVLAPSVTRRLLDDLGRAAPRPVPALDRLTDRELDVLREVATGASNAEIADRLHLSTTTVKTHLGRVLTKLGLRDRVQAVVLAYEAGVVRPGDLGGP